MKCLYGFKSSMSTCILLSILKNIQKRKVTMIAYQIKILHVHSVMLILMLSRKYGLSYAAMLFLLGLRHLCYTMKAYAFAGCCLKTGKQAAILTGPSTIWTDM